MPLTSQHSPLVSGAATMNNAKTTHVRVLRSFMHAGQPTIVGSLVCLSLRDAAVVVSANKAVVELAPPPAAEPSAAAAAALMPARKVARPQRSAPASGELPLDMPGEG